MANFSKKSKYILIGVLVLPILVMASAFLSIGTINKSKTPSIQKEVKTRKLPQGIFSGINLELEDFTFTEYIKVGNIGQRSFVISGKKLEKANPKFGIFRIAIGKILELENPKIIFYKDNLPISMASAKTSSMNPLNKDIIFYDDVSLVTNDKGTLFCGKLKWNNEHTSLLAEDDCNLGAEGEVIQAEAIKTDITLKDYEVINKDEGLLKIVARIFGGGR